MYCQWTPNLSSKPTKLPNSGVVHCYRGGHNFFIKGQIGKKNSTRASIFKPECSVKKIKIFETS